MGAPADSLYATGALRALVADAAEKNKLPADLRSYRAQAETEIAILSRRAEGTEGPVVIEQIASEVRWARDGRYEQRVLGYRSQQIGLTMSLLGLLDNGWVTPTLYGNRLRFHALTDDRSEGQAARGEKPKRRRQRTDTVFLVHPLAEDRDPVYRYTGGDTVVLIRVNGRNVPIARVHVEPHGWPRRRTGVFIGDIDLDATRRQVVRMRGQFAVIGGRRGWRDRASAASVQAVAYVEYVNAEFDGQFWLPSFQRLELQAALPATGDARAVVRFVSRLRDHRVNDSALVFSAGLAVPAGDSTRGAADPRRRRALTWAARDSVERYAAWHGELGEGTAELHADDFDDVAPDVWRPTGPPRLDVRTERSSDLFHFNRGEGVYTGLGVALRLRDAAPGVTLRATGGWAWSERAARGRVQGEWRRGRWLLGARAGRSLDLTNDFREPFDSGSTLAALLFSLDEYDYVDRRTAALSAARFLGGARDGRRPLSVRIEGGLGSDRPVRARLKRGLFAGDSAFRENRGADGGRYLRAAATIEYRPDVNAEFLRPGVGAALRYERGDGDLEWQRMEARLVARRNWRRLTYAARADAGVVLADAPPPQQLFELGQNQNLPGYAYKEFAGDRAAVLRLLAMYTTPFFSSPIRLGSWMVLPSPAPALSAGVQSGWAGTSGAAALASVARLGVRQDPQTGTTVPLSRPSDGIRSSVNVGVRFFGGALFIGAARPVDHRVAWRLSLSFAQQL